MSLLTRQPYQPPQTAMERHLAELVDHLQHGVDSRSGFAESVERAMARAFYLETENQKLRLENRDLDDKLTMNMVPALVASWKDTDLSPQQMHILTWELEALRWRTYMRPHQAQADVSTWRRMRRGVYKQLIQRLREQFDRTFPKNPPCQL